MKLYPTYINGRLQQVSVPEDDHALADAIALLQEIVVGWDQGGREIEARYVERVRAFLEKQ